MMGIDGASRSWIPDLGFTVEPRGIGPIIAFAGYWTQTTRFDNGLRASINGETIKFSDYLGTGDGSGFLGYVVDEASSFSNIDLTLAGLGDDGERFTLDNAMIAGQCVLTLVQASKLRRRLAETSLVDGLATSSVKVLARRGREATRYSLVLIEDSS
jgi:hypothetical protein